MYVILQNYTSSCSEISYYILLCLQDYAGYPSGSMVDFACDQDGYPILAVSSLAVHSKVSCFCLHDSVCKAICFTFPCPLCIDALQFGSITGKYIEAHVWVNKEICIDMQI
jgi:hypothetical protein